MTTAYVALTFRERSRCPMPSPACFRNTGVLGGALVAFECLVVLALTFCFGTKFSTLANGMVVLGIQAFAFMGGWLEQVSGFSQSAQIVTLGIWSSVLNPAESLWRRAAYVMQTPLAGSLSFSPFANVSIPSGLAVGYAAAYLAIVLAVGVRRFAKRYV